MPKLTRPQKILLSIVFFFLLIWILSAAGVLKLKFTVSKSSSLPQSSDTIDQSEPTTKSSQQASLSSRPTTFTTAKGQINFSLKLPVGWKTANNNQLDFVAGSLTPEKLSNGQSFTPNLNAVVDVHQSVVATFADYQAKWKDILLAEYPSMEFVRDSSTKINGMDVYLIEVKNTRPDGSILRQLQYMFYVDDQYAMMMTGTVPNDSWDQYSDIIGQSFASVQKLSE